MALPPLDVAVLLLKVALLTVRAPLSLMATPVAAELPVRTSLLTMSAGVGDAAPLDGEAGQHRLGVAIHLKNAAGAIAVDDDRAAAVDRFGGIGRSCQFHITLLQGDGVGAHGRRVEVDRVGDAEAGVRVGLGDGMAADPGTIESKGLVTVSTL